MATVCCGICMLTGCASHGRVTTISNPVVPIVPTAKAKFAYTGDQGASLSGYSVNTTTGALTLLSGFPLTVGVNPIAVAVDPRNRFLFVADIAQSQLRVFTINSSSGALGEIPTSPYATVHEPIAIAVDPSGTHVYVASQGSNSVGGYSVNAAGALTPIEGSPFPTSGTQNFGDSIVINAAGTFVYVQDLNSVYTYSVSSGSGALALVQSVAGTSIGGNIALDPQGAYLYAVGPGTNSILAFSVDASTGLLTPASPSPMVEQDGAYTISISPSGKFAYTIEKNNYLVSYTLQDGRFTQTGSVFAQVYGERIGIEPSGSFVFVPQACSYCQSGVYNVVNEFSIGSTGALTKLSSSPVAAGTTPWGIAFTTQ